MRILAISSKETYAARRLLAEALVSNCNFVVMPIGELASRQFEVDPEEFDVLYVRNPYQDRSGKYLSGVVDLAKKFKNAGKKVVDAVIANGMLGGGKWDDYEALLSNGLPIPKTEMYNEQSQILKQERFILKWIYGFKGKNVYLAKKGDRILSQHPYSELMLQEYVDAEFEYKVMTVGFKALPVILKFAINPKTKRPDFEKYQVMDLSVTKWDETLNEAVRLAELSSKVLGRELAKTDILERRGRLYVLEVNRFPGLDSFERLTKFNVAKEFMLYLQNSNNKV
jgi:glutathione synthase/RimK-type ligase-like ATP-grasp enzyme